MDKGIGTACTSYGTISLCADATDKSAVSYIGGIVGSATKPGASATKGTEITDGKNYGEITAKEHFGDLVGFNNGEIIESEE